MLVAGALRDGTDGQEVRKSAHEKTILLFVGVFIFHLLIVCWSRPSVERCRLELAKRHLPLVDLAK